MEYPDPSYQNSLLVFLYKCFFYCSVLHVTSLSHVGCLFLLLKTSNTRHRETQTGLVFVFDLKLKGRTMHAFPMGFELLMAAALFHSRI